MRRCTYNKFKCLVIGVVVLMVGSSLWAKIHTKDKGEEKKSEVYLEIPKICQYPTLPTGCESVAATMVLNYYGEDIQAERFAAEWLACDSNFYYENDILFGPDPNEVFAGDPFLKNSYGCFAPVIEKAINENSNLCHAEALYNVSLPEICDTYLRRNQPVLIWATMGMREVIDGKSWILPDGSDFTWPSGEHCLVLIGYDARHYYLNDPICGATVGYSKNIVENRYKMMGSHALFISLKEP